LKGLVNDTYGHDAGDALLKGLALRMQRRLRSSDTLARLGGDEFIVVLPNLWSSTDVLAIAEKILAVVSQPVELPEATLHVGVSIGIARYPDCGEDPDQLIQAADAAMYCAKQGGAQYLPPEQILECVVMIRMIAVNPVVFSVSSVASATMC
jgi:diguanylate cyclase (GGDEF)-like protein